MTTTQQSLLKISLISGAIVSSIALTACSSGSSSSGGSTKTAQTITFSAPMTLGVTETAELNATASSKLAVAYTSTTPEVCSVSEKTVLAKAVGNCTIVAKQAGDSSFKPAEDISVTFAVVPLTVAMSGTDTLRVGKESKISMSGKQVTQNLTATLAGDTIPITSTGDYSAQISVTPTMAGDVPLLVKDGDTVLIDELLQVALPEARGNSFTITKTGVTTCGNLTENNIDCSDQNKLGDYYNTQQDGEIQAGVAMDYIKVAHQVERNGKKSMEYCIYDEITGLMWEQKTDDDGIRDKDWRYSWYDSNPDTNGGYTGIETPYLPEEEDKKFCNTDLVKCNSEAYLQKLNKSNYCGHNDWRLPTKIELINIADLGKAEPPFADSIFNLKVDLGDSSNGSDQFYGSYMTSESNPASDRYKTIGLQSINLINFSSKAFFGNSFGKGNQYIVPGYLILATRTPTKP